MIEGRLIKSLVDYVSGQPHVPQRAIVLATEAAAAILFSALPRPRGISVGAQAEALALITSGVLLAARALGVPVPVGAEETSAITLRLVPPPNQDPAHAVPRRR